jgi:hypothetical protein
MFPNLRHNFFVTGNSRLIIDSADKSGRFVETDLEDLSHWMVLNNSVDDSSQILNIVGDEEVEYSNPPFIPILGETVTYTDDYKDKSFFFFFI